MSDDITGLTRVTKRLIKSAQYVWIPDPEPVVNPITAAQQTSSTYRGDTLVPVPETYSVASPQQSSTDPNVGAGQPDRWLYDDDGKIFYIPRSDFTYGRIP
jgi:hypothetical protein